MATEVEAQIAGNVWKIETEVGAEVGEEDVLLVLESMKMEIPVEAPAAGRVADIRVAEGDSVEEGAILDRVSVARCWSTSRRTCART
jgi:biotin carboxyl carrier protein